MEMVPVYGELKLNAVCVVGVSFVNVPWCPFWSKIDGLYECMSTDDASDLPEQ